MTRGVVHEAFAEVVTDPRPGLVVSKKPPEAIEEVPPEFKPEEEGAIWIPATGLGTTNGTTFSGRAACGACRRRVSGGSPAIGTKSPVAGSG